MLAMLYRRSSYVQDFTAALALALRIPPFEYRPKYWTSTFVLWNILCNVWRIYLSERRWRFRHYVQEHFPEWVSFNPLQHRVKAPPNLGQKGLRQIETNFLLVEVWHVNFIPFQVRNGHIKRITDQDIQSFVLEIVGTNVSTTYITCPAGKWSTCQEFWMNSWHLKFFQTRRKLWGSSFPTLSWSSRTWKSTSHLRFR